MFDDGEAGCFELSADLLCGAVGGDQLGEALFQRAQFAEERVVVGVADFGLVVDEVAAVVVADELAQLLAAVARADPLAICGFGY